MRARLRPADLGPLAIAGLRYRPVRAVLSIIGIGIGIAALVAILGITRSSQADLIARIDRLGTNLLTVVNGRTLNGQEAKLPATSAAALARSSGVVASSATAELPNLHIYRSDLVPAYRTGGLSVRACDTALISTLDGQLVAGSFLNGATVNYPVVVLGSIAARALGIASLDGAPRVYLAERWFAVAGILAPVELAPEIDRSALIGFPAATEHFGYDGHPSRIYVRADTERTAEVAGLLARAADPQHPEQVAVSRPSDTLSARLAVTGAATTLLLGLAGVALLIGGIGIANVMVIAVLERRAEIGLRRALGATRSHVGLQFLAESLALGALGGLTGVLLGIAVTYGVAYERGWPPAVSAGVASGGLAAAVLIGAVAGLYPALRAARLAPANALRVG